MGINRSLTSCECRCGDFQKRELAASGQTVADAAITLMKSRRRITFSKAQDCADYRSDEYDYSRDLRSTKWGSGSSCTAAIVERQCPLWVKSGHHIGSAECPL
jgi:hypothetical protein